MPDTHESLKAIRTVRQTRQFAPDPIGRDHLNEMLEVARWSGSAGNSQPWQFIVIDDKETIRKLSEVRDAIGWVSTAPVVIALALNAERRIAEAYDEGRVSERIMIAADMLGLGSAVAWYGDKEQQARARDILGVPEEYTTRSLIALGHPDPSQDQGSVAVDGGRKPLEEIVSYNTFGQRA